MVQHGAVDGGVRVDFVHPAHAGGTHLFRRSPGPLAHLAGNKAKFMAVLDVTQIECAYISVPESLTQENIKPFSTLRLCAPDITFLFVSFGMRAFYMAIIYTLRSSSFISASDVATCRNTR